MSRSAYLDCISGLAGDMFVAALLDAGAPVERLREVPALLGLGNVEIRVDRVERHRVGALRVELRSDGVQGERRYREVRELLLRSELEAPVREQALEAFARLAEAEATIHGTAVDEVHFHELGAVDSLVDICGALRLLADLRVDHVTCSPLPFSRGLVSSRHGVLPSPAPATLAVLTGVPLVGVGTEGELVTPTGAALAVTTAASFGSLPPLVLDGVGYGAGARDIAERPNVLRVLLGAPVPRQHEVSLLETNVDDMTPELVPDALEGCRAAGALDAWTASVTMKKGRPGMLLSALARPQHEAAVARALLEQTSALGVRVGRLRRYELDREERTVEVDGRSVRVKLGRLDGRVVNAAPEHDDCAAVARATGRSVKSVWAAALAASQRE
jgi:uncharacterized protein (TIGR00299 family) protein